MSLLDWLPPTLAGTLRSAFRLGKPSDSTSVQVKNNSGAVELRNSADSDFVNLSSRGLHNTGARSTAPVTVGATPYAVTATDQVVFLNLASGNVTLPVAVTGRRLIFVKINAGAGTWTLTPNGVEIFEGFPSSTPLTLLTAGASCVLEGITGVGWAVAASYGILPTTGNQSVTTKRPRSFMAVKNPGATTISTFGFAAPTTAGAATGVSTTTGQFISYASAAAINSTAGWSTTLLSAYENAPIFYAVIRTSADISSQRIWVGFTSNPAAMTTIDVAPPTQVAAFRYSTAAGDVNWQGVTSSAVGQTVTNTAIPVVANTTYVLAVDMTDPNRVVYFINGALVGQTTTANRPAAATVLGYITRLTNLVAVTRSLAISLVQGTSL